MKDDEYIIIDDVNDVSDIIEAAVGAIDPNQEFDISDDAVDVLVKNYRKEITLRLDYVDVDDEAKSTILCFYYYDKQEVKHCLLVDIKSSDNDKATVKIYTVDEFIYPAIGRSK